MHLYPVLIDPEVVTIAVPLTWKLKLVLAESEPPVRVRVLGFKLAPKTTEPVTVSGRALYDTGFHEMRPVPPSDKIKLPDTEPLVRVMGADGAMWTVVAVVATELSGPSATLPPLVIIVSCELAPPDVAPQVIAPALRTQQPSQRHEKNSQLRQKPEERTRN